MAWATTLGKLRPFLLSVFAQVPLDAHVKLGAPGGSTVCTANGSHRQATASQSPVPVCHAPPSTARIQSKYRLYDRTGAGSSDSSSQDATQFDQWDYRAGQTTATRRQGPLSTLSLSDVSSLEGSGTLPSEGLCAPAQRGTLVQGFPARLAPAPALPRGARCGGPGTGRGPGLGRGPGTAPRLPSPRRGAALTQEGDYKVHLRLC